MAPWGCGRLRRIAQGRPLLSSEKVPLDSAGPDHAVLRRLKSRGKHIHSKVTATDPTFLPEHKHQHHRVCSFIKQTSSHLCRRASKLTADFAAKLRID